MNLSRIPRFTPVGALALALVAAVGGCGEAPDAAPGALRAGRQAAAQKTVTPELARLLADPVRVAAVHSGLVLEVADAATGNGARVQQSGGTASPHQAWRVSAIAGQADTVTFTATHSGKVLDVDGSSHRKGTVVQQWEPTGGGNQAWRLRPQADGTFEIVNIESGLCLDVARGSRLIGAGVVQWRCSGAAHQHFRLEPIVGPGAGAPTDAAGDWVTAQTKKGAVTWAAPGAAQALAEVGASWAYDRRASAAEGGVQPGNGVEFVPMIWSEQQVTPADLAAAQRDGKALLGFQEPDRDNPQDSQVALSVERALALWPQLAATGLRLGSPATARGADEVGSWLDQFMTGAKARGLRVDFIALHWYSEDFDVATAVTNLQAFVTRVHGRYGLPIWLTQFAMVNAGGRPAYPPVATQAAFATAAVRMLELVPFVERYAWFALPAYGDAAANTHLANADGSLTEVGRAYREARATDVGAVLPPVP